MAPKKPTKRWSQEVTDNSDALDLEKGVFKLKNPKKIALSLKRYHSRASRSPFAVQNNNLLAGHLDNSSLLKKMEGHSYSCSPHTEHQRQKLMRQGHAVAA